MNKEQRSQLSSHLLRIAAYVAGFFWLAFVWGGIKVLSTPDTGRHSHLAAWTILIVAAVIMVATMNHWVKYLQLLLGGFTFGCLLVTIEGHMLNGSPFPRSIAATLATLLVGCSLIAGTLAERKLRTLDRVALVTFLGALVGGTVKETSTSILIGLGVGFGCLLLAWFYNRYSSGKDRRREGKKSGSVGPMPRSESR